MAGKKLQSNILYTLFTSPIMTHKIDSPYKISIVGNFNVGKSSVINRCLYGRFNEITESTIGSAFHSIPAYELPCDDDEKKTVKVHIWDTAGQERYLSLVPMYIRGSDAIIIMYDVTADDSLFAVKSFMKNINSYIENPIIYIVGNKIDLSANIHMCKFEVELLASELGILHYDVSAKDGTNCSLLLSPIMMSICKARKLRFPENQESTTDPIKLTSGSGSGSGSGSSSGLYEYIKCCL